MPGIQIIGEGGFLGKNLFRYLDEQQHSVLGTSHQKQLINSSKFSFLDLLNPNFDFLSAISSRTQFSIICSGHCKYIIIDNMG